MLPNYSIYRAADAHHVARSDKATSLSPRTYVGVVIDCKQIQGYITQTFIFVYIDGKQDNILVLSQAILKLTKAHPGEKMYHLNPPSCLTLVCYLDT